MAKGKACGIVFLLLWIWGGSVGQPVLAEDYPSIPEINQLRSELIRFAESQVGVTELTGRNDVPEIAKYLKDVGLPEGFAYCAAGLVWCHNQLGIQNPKSGWSPDWFKTNVVYRKTQKESILL